MASFFSPPPAGGAAAGKMSRPLKRPAPRFLGDDEDKSEDNIDGEDQRERGIRRNALVNFERKATSTTTTTAQDIDRLFADLDKDDDDNAENNPYRLPAPLESTQTPLINDNITAFGSKKNKQAGASAGEDREGNEALEGKIRRKARPRALMNEQRLLGDRGLRKLKENIKSFKIKGKGYEEEDLRRLMTVYQLWTHQMFPGGTFRDTLEDVERLCRKRGPQAEMRIWRDEAKGIFRPTQDLVDNDANEDEANADGLERGHGGEAINSDEDDQRVRRTAYPGNVPSTTPGYSSPNPNQPKKSYFDNIPTSSPGGALGRDSELADRALEDGNDDDDEDDHVDAGVKQIGGPASEVGFNDADIAFDLDEEPNDPADDEEDMAALVEMEREQEVSTAPSLKVLGSITRERMGITSSTGIQEDSMTDLDFGTNEEAMREMENTTELEEGRYTSRKGALSFYPTVTTQVDRIPVSVADFDQSKGSRHTGVPIKFEQSLVQLDSLDDFVLREEDEIVHEMERAAANEEKAELQSLVNVASASTASSNPDLEFDLPDELELDDDEDIPEVIGNAKISIPEHASAEKVKASEGASFSPSKDGVQEKDADIFEEEEDLYAP